MKNTALILIDIQNDYFPEGRWEVENIEPAAAKAAQLLAFARHAKRPVFHIRHEISSDNAPFFKAGSEGARINNVVAPIEKETIILKHRPNSFVGTDLGAQLAARGIKHLIICGAMTQMCVDSTTRAAVDLGYDVTLIEDACAAKAVLFNGVGVPAHLVHAAIIGPLAGSYAKVQSCSAFLKDAHDA